MSSSTVLRGDDSDKAPSTADTVTQIVMAEQITHDVVKEAQSVGARSPIDDNAPTTKSPAGDGTTPTASHTADSNLPEPVSTKSQPATSTSADVDGKASIAIESEKQLQNPTAIKGEGEALVNGDSGEHSASEDAVTQGPTDVSVGSDTDISRPGSVDPSKERTGGHVRSGSVKKPAAFKSVSVTKNFLAKSAVSAPLARPGEKPPTPGQTNTSTQPSAKPRLVAKSGSGIGNLPRSSLKANGLGAGPDASKVWNKNQPVPPPPPKQFTDEELKQQYGIHLTARLQSDEGSKEAKWADIDDDEDDWAPDTVQWMDGTKSTVVPVENRPPPVEDEPKPALAKESPVPTPKPATPATQTLGGISRPSSTTGTKTILKPGAHVTASSGSGKAGLVLKGQPEKPTLVAKPSAPAPIKSPWAPLPPVDKVPPVQINPPVQHPPPARFSQRESHGRESILPHVPAREVAPDDFNRSWRDERGNKELFNSHSGRYEPVNDVRRGSFRESFRDGTVRGPSVLQRPSHDGPAEPSAAFQTTRTSVDGHGPSWGRRRTSSNLSGGSGRRMSFDRHGVDMPSAPLNIQRRESHSLHGPEGLSPLGTPLGFPQRHHMGEQGHAAPEQHVSWTQRSSPSVAHAQPLSPFGSVGSSAAIETAAPGPVVPLESAVEVQNRLMREKLERARLQKQKEKEEEERLEAEKKERLRKKLEALGLAEDGTKSKATDAPAEKSPQKDLAIPAPASAPAPAPLHSPPKPPVPASEGEIAQYGMIKVHHPHPVKKTMLHLDARAPPARSAAGGSSGGAGGGAGAEAAGVHVKRTPSPAKGRNVDVQPASASGPAGSAQSYPRAAASSARAQAEEVVTSATRNNSTVDNRDNRHQTDHAGANNRNDNRTTASLKGQETAPLPGRPYNPPPPSSAPSSWSATTLQPLQPPIHHPWNTLTQPSTSNVWGPPQAQDRALGNGTFNSQSYTRAQARSHQHPFTPSFSAQQPPQPRDNMHLNPVNGTFVDEGKPNFAAPPAPAYVQPAVEPARGPASRKPKPASPKPKVTSPKSNPIAPRETPASRNPLAGTKWDRFEDQILKDDKERAAKDWEIFHREGGATWRPTITSATYIDPKSKAKRTVALDKVATAEAAVAVDVAKPVEQAKSAVVNAVEPVPKEVEVASATKPAARASRFFPHQSDAQVKDGEAKTDSPPPPETETHPVYDGDNTPQVRIPVPAPVVRLPRVPGAAVAAPVDSAVIMPLRPNSSYVGVRPIVNSSEWQARFDGLLAKTTPPVQAGSVAAAVGHSKTNAPAVMAASKAPLDVRGGQATATVSLPAGADKKVFTEDSSSEVISRGTAEDELLEDREFGSLPVINLPKVEHLRAGEPAAPFPPHVRPHLRGRVHVQSKPIFDCGEIDFERLTSLSVEQIQVRIKIMGMIDEVVKTMPPSKKTKPTNVTQGVSNVARSNKNAQSGRGRNNVSSKGPTSSNASTVNSRASNGSFNSNRTTNTRSSQAQGWNKRAPPVY